MATFVMLKVINLIKFKVMKTKKYKTMEGLLRHAGRFNLYQFLTGRGWFNGKYYNFVLPSDERQRLAEVFADVLYSRRSKCKAHLIKNADSSAACGITERLYIKKDKETGKFYASYCAGQDYPSEIRCIQKLIRDAQ